MPGAQSRVSQTKLDEVVIGQIEDYSVHTQEGGGYIGLFEAVPHIEE